MKIKINEIEIDETNPFLNCKLERAGYAKILTQIVDNYADGFVLAINNKWGTGKTTFVKMWQQELKNQKFKTVYFNAWENDFESNPLIALMGELKTISDIQTKTKFNSALKKAAVLSKNILPAVAQAIAKRYVDSEELVKGIGDAAKGVTEIFENEVNDYANKKKSIHDFRTNLADFISETDSEKPIIFIIDELDRCRPDYAVSILEQIKHFFSIPNIVFVLSIDKIQLGNAVRGVYGNDRIDADEYLRRFIDIEYSIPEPKSELYYKYLFEIYKFEDFFSNQDRLKHPELQQDKKDFLNTCKVLFTNSNVPLRQQEKVFSHARIALRSFDQNSYVVPSIFIFLNYVKICHASFYLKLKSKEHNLTSLQNSFYSIIQNSINKDNEGALIWLEAHILAFYNNYFLDERSRTSLYNRDEKTGENVTTISSVVNPERKKLLLHLLVEMDRFRGLGDLDLGYFLARIELFEEIKM